MSEAVQIYKEIQKMRDEFTAKWRDYKSMLESDGKVKETTIELKRAQDKQCEKIQKMIEKEFGSEEFQRIIKGANHG